MDLSVLIPSRNEPYLQKTIDDLCEKSKTDFEIIVVLDGYWPDPAIKSHPKVILIHNSEPQGMRASINEAARIAKGKFLMKCDAHCMFEREFDVILKNDCQEDWMLVPSRHSLDPDKWEINKKERPPVEYNYVTYPYQSDSQFGTGFHGKKWMTREDLGFSSYYGKEIEKKEIKIDDIIAFQGSCWFMPRELFFKIGCLDEVRSYNIYQEAQELVFKVWLSGGRVAVDKNTWYAHFHKKESTFRLSYDAKKETERFSSWIWMNDKWEKRKKDFRWLIEKFMPMPGWPVDWKAKEDNNFRIFNAEGHDGYS